MMPNIVRALTSNMTPETLKWFEASVKANQRARLLLLEMLSPTQRFFYLRFGRCWIFTKLGRFTLHNRCIRPFSRGFTSYCLQVSYSIPDDDIKVAGLMLLRSNPELFIKTAGKHHAFSR